MKKLEKKEVSKLSLTAKLFILSGIIAFLYVGYWFYKIQSSKHWIPVDAKITDVKISSFKSSRKRGRGSVRIFLDYEYLVDSKVYKGKRLIFPSHDSKVTVEYYRRMYDKLYASKIIKVYYNPNEPTDVVVINGVTNRWISLVFYAIWWNSIILGFLLAWRFGKLRLLLIPVFVLIFWKVISSSRIIKIDASKLINVVEAYPSNDCRFKEPFRHWVYMNINNERMEGKHQDFTPRSSIGKVEILEKEMQVDSIVNSIIKVNYAHLGESRSKKFKLRFQRHNRCDYRFLEAIPIE